MASAFETNFLVSAWGVLTFSHGETVTYKSGGTGDGTNITAIWNPGATIPGYYDDGEIDKSIGVVIASTSDVSSPSLRDTFTISSVTWACEEWEDDGPVIQLQLTRIARQRLGGDLSRNRR